MTKVLYVSSRGDAGAGGENYLLSIFRHMDRTRWSPVVLLPADGTLRPALEAMDIPVHVLDRHYPWLVAPRQWYDMLDGLQQQTHRILELIQAEDIALVHTNSNKELVGALAAALAGVPHVYLAHIERQTDMPLYRRLPLDQGSFGAIMDGLSARIIAVSDSVAATLRPYVSEGKLTVIHNGIEPARFDAALAAGGSPLRAELGIPADSPLVTAVGRICPDKGFDYFAEAASRVAAADARAHFLIAGGVDIPAFDEELRQAVAASPALAGRFHFLGFRPDVPEVLAQSDIFVLASRREGHPYVLLEAMAARCAPVASLCAGVAETLEEGITGFTMPIGDVDGMAAAVLRLLRDPGERGRMASAAHAAVRARFTAQGTADRLCSAYAEILARGTPRPGSPTVALFLQACREIGQLGNEIQELRQRLHEVEQSTDFIRNNPPRKLLRRIRAGLRGKS